MSGNPLVTRHESVACDRLRMGGCDALGRTTRHSVQEGSEHDYKRSERWAGRHSTDSHRRTGTSRWAGSVSATTGGFSDLLFGDRGPDRSRPGGETWRL